MYFRDANVALIIFDVTNKASMDEVTYWAQEIDKANTESFITILIGNKSDLEERR